LPGIFQPVAQGWPLPGIGIRNKQLGPGGGGVPFFKAAGEYLKLSPAPTTTPPTGILHRENLAHSPGPARPAEMPFFPPTRGVPLQTRGNPKLARPRQSNPLGPIRINGPRGWPESPKGSRCISEEDRRTPAGRQRGGGEFFGSRGPKYNPGDSGPGHEYPGWSPGLMWPPSLRAGWGRGGTPPPSIWGIPVAWPRGRPMPLEQGWGGFPRLINRPNGRRISPPKTIGGARGISQALRFSPKTVTGGGPPGGRARVTWIGISGRRNFELCHTRAPGFRVL